MCLRATFVTCISLFHTQSHSHHLPSFHLSHFNSFLIIHIYSQRHTFAYNSFVFISRFHLTQILSQHDPFISHTNTFTTIVHFFRIPVHSQASQAICILTDGTVRRILQRERGEKNECNKKKDGYLSYSILFPIRLDHNVSA